MNILIFGGAGFVGRHYSEYFLKRNDNVKVIDNIAPLSGGIHPKKWKLFNPYKFNKKFKRGELMETIVLALLMFVGEPQKLVEHYYVQDHHHFANQVLILP